MPFGSAAFSRRAELSPFRAFPFRSLPGITQRYRRLNTGLPFAASSCLRRNIPVSRTDKMPGCASAGRAPGGTTAGFRESGLRYDRKSVPSRPPRLGTVKSLMRFTLASMLCAADTSGVSDLSAVGASPAGRRIACVQTSSVICPSSVLTPAHDEIRPLSRTSVPGSREEFRRRLLHKSSARCR